MDDREKIDFRSFRYILFNPRSIHFSYTRKFDEVFQFWSQAWTETLQALEGNGAVNAYDFFRQDYIGSLWHKDRVVGVHLYSVFDIKPDCTFKHPYFQNSFNEEFLKYLRQQKYQKVMSKEYFFLSPELRKSSGVSDMALVLLSLGVHVFLELTPADVSIGPARVDRKVNEICYSVGYESIIRGIRMHNVPVDLMALKRSDAICDNLESVELKNYLWNNKELAEQPERNRHLKVA